MTQTKHLEQSAERLIDRQELRQLLPASDATVWRWTKDHGFPAPLKVSNGGRRYWRLSAILAWIAARESNSTGAKAA